MHIYRGCSLIGLGLMAAVVVSQPVSAQDMDYNKALQLYLQVLRGEKKLADLTPQEQQQVLIMHRVMSRGGDDSGSSECRDARERARSAAEDLASRAGRLKSCAENTDYSDDCSSEFRRVKSAFSDYESAVSEVSSDCD